MHRRALTNESFGDIAFADASVGVIVGTFAILRTDDGGVTWSAANFPEFSFRQLLAVRFGGGATAIAVGREGEILRSTDNGSNWSVLTSGTTDPLNSVFILSADTAFVVGDNGHLLLTDDAGASWSERNMGAIDLHDTWFMDSSTGVMIGSSGTILRTVTGGRFWAPMTSPTTNNLNRLFFTDADHGVAVGTSTVLRTVDGGFNWTIQTESVPGTLTDVSFIDGLIGTAVGGQASTPIILGTGDGGITWTSQTRFANLPALTRCASKHGATVIAIGDFGTIARSTDWGRTWAQVTNGGWELRDISMPHSQVGTVVGQRGTIRRTLDGGATWQPQTSNTFADLQGVDFRDVHKGVAVGGAIVATRDGRSWTIHRANTILGDVAWVTGDTLVAVGAAGEILQSVDASFTWNPVSSGTSRDLYTVDFWSNGIGIVAGHEVVLRSVDRGSTWTAQSSTLAARYWNLSVADGGAGAMVVDPQSPSSVLFTSDWGASWSPQRPPVPQVSGILGVHLTSADVGTLVGDRGIIMRTFNGGVTTP